MLSRISEYEDGLTGSAKPMQDYEKLGLFYLGKTYDMKERQVTPNLVLYESKHLTTHAVCVGMTGSGKTGLGIALLEEAAIDGIPVIAIDPKGDLGNSALDFSRASSGGFSAMGRPDEAARRGLTIEQFAAQTAEQWRKGLAAWDQDGERIERLRDAVDLAIYTPGSTAGLPLTVLRSFDAPPPAPGRTGRGLPRAGCVGRLGPAGSLGIVVDPIIEPGAHLCSQMSWIMPGDGARPRHGKLDPCVSSRRRFRKLGVMDCETFFPAKERFALAMKLNNLLASPGFAAWLEGEPLDVGGLLYTRDGKPRLSIVSIAHLVGQRADVLRHHSLERGAGLDSHPAWHIEPARDSLHGRDLRLLSPHRQSAVEGADADPAQAGPRISAWASCWRPRTRSTSTTRDCQTRGRGSWAACRPSAIRIACSRDWKGPRPRPGTPLTARKWTRFFRGWATASS